MEEPQRSRHVTRAHSSKKTANGNGYSGDCTVYDDIFGGPPKYTVPSFPPCVDEYAEIFRGSSTVPFLDFSGGFFDGDGDGLLVSGDSYADIFGGYGDDFLVSFEELIGRKEARAERKASDGDRPKRNRVDRERKSLQKVLSKVSSVSLKKSDGVLQKVPSKLSSISSENSDGTLFSIIDNIPILSNPDSQHLHKSQKQMDMSFHMKNCKVKERYRNDRANHQDASFACEFVGDGCLPNLDNPTSNGTANPVNNTSSGFSVIEEAAQIKPKVETSLTKSSGKNSASMPSNEFKEGPCEMEPMSHLMEDDSCFKAKTKASSTISSGNFQPETLENELQDNNRVTHTKPLPVENSPSFNLNVQASCNDYCIDKSTSVFVTVTEVNLQTHPTPLPPPTRPPPKLGLKSESKKRLGSSVNDFKENGNSPTAVNNHRRNHTEIAPETHFVEEDMKQRSPTFLDVEVNANSDAAASAAAMKEVMEEAKAKLKILKESMARRNSLKTNKNLSGREKKKSKEHENCEAAQEFFDCNIEMDPEVWDVPCAKIKNSGQVERSKEIKTPKDIFELQEKQKCLDLAENCSEKGLGNRQDVVKEFVKHEMKGIPNDCARQAKQGHEIRSSELVFKLQEKQRCFELGQKCAEEKLGNGSNGVNESQQQNVNKKDYKMEELSNQEANNKMPQRVVQASEKEQQEKKFKPDEETHEIAFNSATGQSEVERPKMAQEVHQKEGKEKSPKTGQKLQEANEQECQNTVAREAYDPKENLSRLKDGQSSSMQDMVYKTKQVDAEKLAEADPEESLSRLKNGQASGTQEEVHDNKQVYAQSLAEQEEITKLNKEDQEAHEQEQKVQEEELTIKKPQPEEEKDNLKTDQKECDGNEMGSRIPVVLETIDQKEGSKEDSNKSMKGETSRLSDKVLKREENAVQELVEGKTTKLEADQVVHEHEQNVQVFRKTQDSSDVDASEKQPDSDNKIPMQEIESQKLEGSQKINQSEQKEHTFKMSQQEAEKEKNLKTDQKNWKENEGECEFPMAWGTHEQRESSNRLSTYHASRKQDDTCNDIEQTSYEPVEHEETTMLKADTNHVSRKQNDLHSDEEKTAHEPVELEEITMLKTVQEAHEHEHNKKKFTTVQDSGDLETNAQRTNIAQGPMQKTNEKKSEVSQHINQLEKREQTLKATNQINEEQKIRKFSDKTQERAEKEKTQLGKERLKRELEQEMEQLMKLEEEKERVREREKDRIAVERATHEARDKAIPDAWERAERAAVERATAEAREKASMERREKAEKIPPESKEKIPGEKISTEGRIKPDQAAIDRATAEARERAAERAIVEKVAAEARERMERAVAERFAASLKEKQRKDNECDDGASTRVNSARHTSTSDVQNLTRDASSQAYSVTKHTEIGVETEKRRQAKLERYQRTTERTAKALAEKKARDILAQREQAERNRLAESLDADIRRWSNGKEGNLRALISTLQYILGLESGWQPVPLTEVITSAAVKKAYRKATLCVHPDKVQQRGASIQQKYISEKVFDLLKEAWNKFNSEER